MTEEVKNKLIENGLSEYVDLFEQQKLDTEELLGELNQYDFEKLGINIIGDQKKLLKLFQKQEVIVAEIKEQSVIKKDPVWKDILLEDYKREGERQPVIINNSSSGDNAAYTGLAVIVGGILGVIAVIALIILMISHEALSL